MDPLAIPTYDECLALTKASDAFVWKSEMVDGVYITSFKYRLASYGDFNQHGARNLRGITFRADTKELVALPFAKFFNYGENPFTEASIVDSWNPVIIHDKLDGSLVYFYMVDDRIQCKTKYDCFAPQAQAALKFLYDNSVRYAAVLEACLQGLTPMFEYIGPDNQIVLRYDQSDLVYLGSRDMKTGDLISHEPAGFHHFTKPKAYDIRMSEVIDHCQSGEGEFVEGYVVRYDNGELVKFKTKKYKDVHHLLSSIQSGDKYIASLTLNNQLDDALPTIPEFMHKQVMETSKKVRVAYLTKVDKAYAFHEKYSGGLTQKLYAVTAMEELGRGSEEFGIAMSLYNHNFNEKKFIDRFIANECWKK